MPPPNLLSQVRNLFKEEELDFVSSRAQHFTIETERTSTVFSGQPQEWVEYMNTPWDERRNHPLLIEIQLDPEQRKIRLEPKNADSKDFAKWMEHGFKILGKQIRNHPHAHKELDKLLFQNGSNFNTLLEIHATSPLPANATREVRFDSELRPVEVDIVLKAELVECISDRMRSLNKKDSDMKRLGILWPILRRIISQLGYASYPRDRFKDRILLSASLCQITLDSMYSGKKKGRLLPNEAGVEYEAYLSRQEDIPLEHIQERHPYLRMLNELSYLMREKNAASFSGTIQVIVRDYLDQRYLRLSLAGVMPGMLEWMAPMEYSYGKENRIECPKPKRGRYGILDEEDLMAWKKAREPLHEVGLTLLRQLGMGQFGRVYECLNTGNSKLPQRVAVKVDRIRKKAKQEAILGDELIMQIGRDVAHSPHVVRIYDAGRLKQLKSHYHVMQLIDGDTLDNLIGVTGTEHSSVYRPEVARTDMQKLKSEYLKAVRSSGGERWRKSRVSLPFTRKLGLPQALDLITSTLLWLEEVHGLNYAINDLKNGNLMVSRRGQLKGIDLDTYSPVFSSLDKIPDFFFLAVTLLMFVLNVLTEGNDQHITAQGLLGDMEALRAKLHEIWRFGSLSEKSDGRVHVREVINWLVDCIDKSRNGAFAHDPALFSASIDDLIHIKRSLTQEEMVLD